MKEAKHTQGEWERDGGTIAVFGRGIIAECPRPQNGGVFECTDNARLVAAAPELLEALQQGHRKLETYVSVYAGDKELRRLLELWNSAIAKATGETP